MKFVLFILVASIGPLWAAQAQATKGLAVGASVPQGDRARIDNVGFHVLGTVASMPSSGGAGFRADAMFHQFSRKATIQDVSERIAGLVAATVVPTVEAAISPYLIGGFGVYRTWTDPQPIGARREFNLGFNIGAGARFQLGGRPMFAEARYHQVMADGGPRFLPLSVGMTF